MSDEKSTPEKMEVGENAEKAVSDEATNVESVLECKTEMTPSTDETSEKRMEIGADNPEKRKSVDSDAKNSNMEDGEPVAKKPKLAENEEGGADSKNVANGVEKGSDDVAGYEVATLTDIEARIVKQLLYYFGDINLPRDRFLLEQVNLGQDGWVPLSVLLTFRRLRAITEDEEVVAKAVIHSGERMLQINKDMTKLRRNPAMPAPELNEERRKELMERTAFVKGFPQESTLEVLLQFFEQYGRIDAVHMRYMVVKTETKQHVFKGSVFVVFQEAGACRTFLEQPEVKYKGVELQKQWQSEFVEEKRAERRAREQQAADGNAPPSASNVDDSDEEMTVAGQPSNQQQQPSQAAASSAQGGTDGDEDGDRDTVTFPKGSVLHLSGVTRRVTRDLLRRALVQKGHTPVYVSLQKGTAEAWARFPEKDEAVTLLNKLEDAKITVAGAELIGRVLEGDEEDRYFKDAAESMSKRKNTRANAKWKGKRRGGSPAGGNSAADASTRPKRTRR